MGTLLAWLFSPELGRDKLALLVLCAWATFIVGANLAWRLQLGRSWIGRTIRQAFRFVHYLGIPVLLLWRGVWVVQTGVPTTYVGEGRLDLALQFLGLGGVQDLWQIGRGVVLSAGALLLLTALWVWYARAAPVSNEDLVPVSWWVALREALLYQVYWAFYRGVIALWTGDRVHIAFASLGLVALSWVFSPQRRHDLFTAQGYLVVQDWACALFTSLLSLSVSTLWLLLLSHTLWLLIGSRVLTRFRAIAVQSAAHPFDPSQEIRQ